ncbi:putative bifunctional diguanylate cyclase/phosphodiesterase [Inhella crocodyli]|uniref:EAL domain-containing protein n=1 Tax=Inhella crocodyli TaxID=2499851 RepID=A0A437LCU9_9BURK|nr:EAL domain-containing protein [Inhella crocodyli]RVT83139.1 EAL domain-containing protein [Inhella crocodyli]
MNDAPRPRLLLVDDEEVARLLTQAALQERGFVVDTVDSGEAALDWLAVQQPDAVLLDARMPGLDGFETCARIREFIDLDQLPVLMLTALDDEASIERAYQVGANDFFIKGPHWSLLVGRLRYLLRASRTVKELARSKERLARAQDLARMGSFEWHDRAQVLNLSAEGQRALGLPLDEAPGLLALVQLVARAERRLFIRRMRELHAHSGILVTDVPLCLPDGRQRIVHLEVEPEYAFEEGSPRRGFSGVVQDVTDRRQAEDRIRQLAHFDALTGLPNRRQLIWRTDRAIEAARRLGHQVALLLIDLDRFKNVNDTLGHAAGDELLVEVSRRLRSCVRHSEQVIEGALEGGGTRGHRSLEAVGRLGGDEFVALLPEVQGHGDAERVAQRMLEALREPVYVGGQDCFVTASVGIALFPRDGANVADMMRNADMAMYTVKEQGRNASAQFSPQLAAQGRARLALESALHKAIERHELVLYYQPKVDVRQARMVGVEALMRWRRDGKLVPPNEFIPVAEESGLIVPMSDWALGEAARQAQVWAQDFDFAEAIAVNLPNRLFERADLVEHIHQCVNAHGVPHRSLQLEITETGLMKDLESVIPTLQRLNEAGVKISIDDFGTGYSSLSYLTSLPLSELKIDRSFVKDLGSSPQSSAVVTAILALARSLGLRVVAEGVETIRQMEVLHRLGCRVMQGFLFAKPMPPDEIPTWLATTVLPRQAEWIASSTLERGGDAARPLAARP